MHSILRGEPKYKLVCIHWADWFRYAKAGGARKPRQIDSCGRGNDGR